MKSRFIQTLILITLLAANASPAVVLGQECSLEELANCTVRDAYAEIVADLISPETADSLRSNSDPQVVNSNTATPSPDAFASRVHASFQNFLNVFDLGISDFEEGEDGQSLIVRFNPRTRSNNQFGLSLTVTKPQISDTLKEAIPEDTRSAAVEGLESQLSDLDDLTWTASFTNSTKQCTPEKAATGCHGRNPKIYRGLLSKALSRAAARQDASVERAVSNSDDFGLDEKIAGLFPDVASGSIFGQPVSRATDPDEVIATLRELALQDAEAQQTSQAFYTENGFQNLAALIDNQPQLAISGSYRDPGPIGGPDEAALSIEYQFGGNNVNKLFGGDTDPLERLKELKDADLSDKKFVLSISYKWRDSFSRDELMYSDTSGNPVTLTDLDIDLEKKNNIMGRIQWGKSLAASIGGRNARIDFSLEAIWTDDEETRNQNRWVGGVTYTLPLGKQMSLPISINYADKPEFLSDSRDRLGVHFGISYRLPWEKDKT